MAAEKARAKVVETQDRVNKKTRESFEGVEKKMKLQ